MKKKVVPARPRPSKSKIFELALKSSLKEIGQVEEMLRRVKRSVRLVEDDYYRLLVATNEAVMNGIVHGNKSDPRKKVEIRVEASPGMVTVYVSDSGTGFDEVDIPDPLADENLTKESGRGVFLIKQLMDRVHIDSSPHGTTIEMILIEQ